MRTKRERAQPDPTRFSSLVAAPGFSDSKRRTDDTRALRPGARPPSLPQRGERVDLTEGPVHGRAGRHVAEQMLLARSASMSGAERLGAPGEHQHRLHQDLAPVMDRQLLSGRRGSRRQHLSQTQPVRERPQGVQPDMGHHAVATRLDPYPQRAVTVHLPGALPARHFERAEAGGDVEVAQFAGLQTGAGETSTTSRSRSLAARAAAMTLAATIVEELGSGSGRGGMSPSMIGLRIGASGQSHSMIRSKNMRSSRSRWRVALAARAWP